MTNKHESNTRNPPSTILPWLVAAGVLVLYLVTLNRWVTLGNLGQIIQLGRWDGQLPFYWPLYFVVTYPLSWLPMSWQPQALNLLAAICAVLTLALLARSVMLLPHDRTREQRLREHSPSARLSIPGAWLPPVLAVLVCGLQLSFWDNATAGTSEMFDLLLFAYVIRCLLEYRVTQQESWLTKFALVYGLAIPNNWAMIGFAPAFLVALIWIKGTGFFKWRFIGRLAACGAVGLLLYLLLPLLHSASSLSDATFWQALKANLVGQKSMVRNALALPKYVALLLALTSLLPVVVMGIRWKSSLGDTNAISIKLTTWMFHLVHGLFLVACVVAAFDSVFSPRKLSMEIGLRTSFLTLYYLGALSIGYFSGYFLLVFGTEPSGPRSRAGFLRRATNGVITVILWLALVGGPAALIYQNLPRIRANSAVPLRQYAELQAKSLPKNAVVLSDDPTELYLLTATLHRNKTVDDYLLLDTRLLKLAKYHEFLSKRYAQRWPYRTSTNNPTGLIDDVSLMKMMFDLSRSNEVYYLHPSFGYYFEEFYMRPHGLVYQLKTYTTNSINAPSSTPDEISENENFWKQIGTDVLSPLPGLVKQRGFAATLVSTYYSRALNYWGVELQKSGQFDDAAAHFQRAVELNPDNVVAQINLDYNRDRRAGKKSTVDVAKTIEDRFSKYSNWEQIMRANGPFDEPNFCFEQGRIFTKGRNYRQAVQQFDRVAALAPDHLAARLWLGQLMIMGRMPGKVLDLVAEIRAHPETFPLDQTNQIELIRLEASAQFASTNSQAADDILQAALTKYPQDKNLLAAVAQVQMAFGHHAEAMTTVEKLLSLAPDDPQALLSKGALCIQLKTFKEAVAPLTRLLELQPDNNAALLNRAIANLQIDELDAAQSDYEKLRTAFPSAFQVYYGLGEIAFRKKDWQNAIKNYELYLKHAPPNTEERRSISARLKELKDGSP
ncbi:MAG: tetratricopeptide repeat protein [Verrucomicrobia bacterium]|nr:tetratricopeptide repeat protein [Verrucomicrobiota bacterium]